MAYQQSLEDICQRVEDYFVTQIADLSNSELEYVAQELASKFDAILERAQIAIQSAEKR